MSLLPSFSPDESDSEPLEVSNNFLLYGLLWSNLHVDNAARMANFYK